MGNSAAFAKGGKDQIYKLEGRPPLSVAIPIGLQHVLSMFTGNLAPILILAGAAKVTNDQRILMLQCAMIASAITTIIQLYPIKIGKHFQIGSGLPIVMGTAFAFVPTMITVGGTFGINVVLGASLIGAFSEIILGLCYRWLKKLFSPLVIGAVLITIGINLLRTGAVYFGGGQSALTAMLNGEASTFGSWQNLLMGFSVFLTIMVLQRFGKGMVKVCAVLIGLVVGYVLALLLHQIDLSQIANAGWISVPRPLSIMPEFKPQAILMFLAVYIVSGLETMGNTSGITIAAFNRQATEKETSGAIVCDAVGSQFANFFNTLPNTAFGQNAGLVAMTKVVNRFCIACGAGILLLAGLVPKIGAVFSVIPSSVLGGAVITIFAIILINGIKMVAKAGFTDKNVLALAVTFGVGYGFSAVPQITTIMPGFLQFILHDAVTAVCIVAVITNLIFNGLNHEDPRDSAEAAEVGVG